jgi:choline kinase
MSRQWKIAKPAVGVILAGGYGRRLTIGRDVPHKSLLKLSDGKSIIGRMIDHLSASQIRRIIVLHFFPPVQQLLDEAQSQARRIGAEITLVKQDPQFEYGTMYALRNVCLASGGQNDLVVVDGDIICAQTVVEQVCQADGTLLVIDDVNSTDPESMKARVTSDGIEYLSKTIEGYPEFCGIMRLTPETCDLFVEASSLVRLPEPYYEDAFNVAFSRGVRFPFLTIPQHQWIEVDTPDDYAEALVKMESW